MENVMKTFVSLVVALGLVAGAAAPSFAAEPKTKADCVKAHMKWDDTTKKCSK
jgi:ABC-type proline/glycine betaine transport system substrate-binding protein